MSAARKHTARKHAANEPKSDPARAETCKPRWKVVARTTEAPAGTGLDTAPDATPDHIPLDRLRAASGPGVNRAPLPFRPALEAMFGRDLPAVEVLTGPGIEAALDREGAEAAARDGLLFLRRDASLPVVAHELAHALQPRRAAPDPTAAEAEARALEWRATQGATLPRPVAPLAPGVTAFRMQGAQVEPEPAQSEPPAPATPAPATPTSEPAAPVAAEAPAAQAGAAAAPEAAAETLDPAAAPDLTAQTEAAAAEAQAATVALDAARDAEGVMAAFQAAPPSVKAREAAGLDARIAAASTRARAEEDAALPEFRAEMSPGQALPAAPPVTAPATAPGALEAAPPPPAPLPELAPTPDPGRAAANTNLAPALDRDFMVGDPGTLDRTFSQVQTSDGAAMPSAGPAPHVPLSGATDPARTADQEGAAAAQAAASQAEAARAVVDGPGPERAQLRAMSEAVAPRPPAPTEPAPAQPPVAGAAAFAAQPLDAETVALFDRAHGPAMQQSLAGAQQGLDRAAAERTAGRETAVAETEDETARLNAEADGAQQGEVVARRAEIQGARQDALDQQAGHVAALRDEAATARAAAGTEVDAEVSRTETRIDADFARAETDAQARVAEGEARAATTRDAAEREAENQGWWDRALDWVKSQLARLTEAINAIFDAVRAAVRGIIEAVKSAALALIDAAAGLIRGIIETFGALLKTLVTRLLAQHFPAIAAALNAAIDAAVNAANAAIDRIANALKAGIAFLMDALAASLDAVLAAWQAATNAALALANAALQGDWRALARLILSPILMALGIPPDAFFQLFDRAAQAIDLIVANPGGFVQNLLDAVKGGIRRFADNFRRHLIAGIILWLTGPLGRGIAMPAEFDLWGLLDVTRQALGLTLETVRRVAVRVIGEGAVRKIEYVLGYVRALITGGWQGLWEQITSDLGMLRDMVLDQIKTFLLKKVVIASIMWLASMFNPVGALVKLVMTIWNFVKFLRAQLSKIFAVAQTVINTMWEIATGALEPPIRGVEQVLGRLVPVVLDLLARLIGVDGIPQKVQDILKAVRLRIETALENLMRRVLAAFGIEAKPASDEDNPDDLMQPLTFAGGGETHTLYIHETGSGVVPTMRSTPTPVAAWLQSLRGSGLDRIGNDKRPRWTPETVAQKRLEIEPLIFQAIGKEEAVDQKGEEANTAEDQALATEEGEKPAPSPVLLLEGEALAEILSRILEKLGLAALPLDQIFSREIEAMRTDVAENLKTYILPPLDAARYGTMTWQAFGAALSVEPLTEPWRSPCASGGAARRIDGFTDAVKREAIVIATEQGRSDADAIFAAPDAVDKLFANQLTQALDTAATRAQVTQRLLGSRYTPLIHWVRDFRPTLEEAVKKFSEAGKEPDADIKANIDAGNFVSRFEDAATTRGLSYNYYPNQKQDGSPDGSAEATHPLVWFLQPQGGSPRNGANRKHVSTAIRNADPGQHEWIPASLARLAISKTAQEFDAEGRPDEISGVANFIEFQHQVRTPTRNLIFKPDSFPEVSNAREPYISRAHNLLGLSYDELTDAQRLQCYPPSGPAFGESVPVLQAHAGGLNARAATGEGLGWTRLQSASPRWHINLEQRITVSISSGVEMRGMREMREQILGFFQETIWKDSPDLGNPSFDLYQLGGTPAAIGYSNIKQFAGTVYDRTYGALRDAMDEVINS